MNERIYELSGKASKDINFFPVENIEQWHQFTEKFAELIVRECALVVYKQDERKSNLNLTLSILEHFGVEE